MSSVLPALRAPAPQGTADVVLIGYQDQGNLGMGYLAAVLQRVGRVVEMVEVRDGPERIAERLKSRQPLIIGFSLIFQCFLPQFRELAIHLRSEGITSHFTIGGHFPSLCHDECLTNFPELDSVVRYEGEETLVELVERISNGNDWRDTPGIAYLNDGKIIETTPRPLVQDLDSLPFPYRPYEVEHIGGFATLPVLASRGCVRRCSFCSIHTFYRTAPGKVVRVRKPAKIIEEMQLLHDQFGVRIYLFQDDDFPLWGRVGREWADELVGRMHDSGLADHTVWKISCRGEYVDLELFSKLRDAGLFLVYMGIESGDEEGLKVLNKEMTVEQNLEAVRMLKELGILVSYGFMLFDPSSTFASVRGNVNFLRQMVGDGRAGAVFSRMLPYGGTPIRDQLQKEGRLRGGLTNPDYVFLDTRLNDYHRLLTTAVRPWIHKQGLSYQLNYAWDEFESIRRLAPAVWGADEYQTQLRALTAESNEQLFRLIEESSRGFEEGDLSSLEPFAIREYCENNQQRLLTIRDHFVAENIDLLMEAINPNCATGPVISPQVH